MSKDSPARYYQKSKEKIKKILVKGIKIRKRKRRRRKGKKKKKKKTESSHEQYKILSENEKQKLVEYRKSYYEM